MPSTSKAASVYKGQKAYTRDEALDHFREAAAVATKPFIYLSAGVSNAQFVESLHMAAEAGTDYSGVLCGRATWKEGIPVYAKQGAKALEDWLRAGRREEYQRGERRHQGRHALVRQNGNWRSGVTEGCGTGQLHISVRSKV